MDKLIALIKTSWKKLILIYIFLIPLLLILPYIVGKYIPIIPVFISVGDLLSFYGGVLAVVGTVFLGYVAYNQNINLIENSIKTTHLSKKPYLSVTRLVSSINDPIIPSHELTHNELTSFTDDFDVNISQKKLKYNIDFIKIMKVYFMVHPDSINVVPHLGKKHQDYILNHFQDGDTQLHHLFFPLEIENIGGGSCLNLRYSLHSPDAPLNERLAPAPIPLTVGNKIYVGIYFKDVITRELDLYFIYQDIFNNGFQQTYKIICKPENITMDFISLQEGLNEDQLNHYFAYDKDK